MTLLKIEMTKGKSQEYAASVMDIGHTGLIEAFGIDDGNRFQQIIKSNREEFSLPKEKKKGFHDYRIDNLSEEKQGIKEESYRTYHVYS